MVSLFARLRRSVRRAAPRWHPKCAATGYYSMLSSERVAEGDAGATFQVLSARLGNRCRLSGVGDERGPLCAGIRQHERST